MTIPESMEEILGGYPLNERATAERMMEEGVKAVYEDTGDGIIKSHVSDTVVIIYTSPAGESFYCVKCRTEKCAHCIISRVCFSGLMEDDADADDHVDEEQFFISIPETEERIGTLGDYSMGHIYEDRRYGYGYRWRDEYDDQYEAVAEVVDEIFADMIEGIDSISEIMRLTNMIYEETDAIGCSDPIYNALYRHEEVLKEKMSGMSAEEFADAVCGQKLRWFFHHMPQFDKSDTGYLLERFREAGVGVNELKDLYFRLERYEEFVKECEKYTDPSAIMAAAVALEAQDRREVVREAVSKIGINHCNLIIEHKEFVESIGMSGLLADCIERTVKYAFDTELFSDMLRLTGVSEEEAVREFTLRGERLSEKTLCAFVEMGYADRIEEYVRENGYRSMEMHSWVSLEHCMVNAGKVECAVFMRRNRIMDILDGYRNMEYGVAVSIMRMLEEVHRSGADSSVKPSHEEFFEKIKVEHKTKRKFWGLYNGTYRG